MINVKNIHKAFGGLEVLKGITLNVAKGEVVSIVGASGAGKTTLLQILGTLDVATSGELLIADQTTFNLSRSGLADFRNKHIGFVFQFHRLLPEFTALENVIIPAWIAGTRDEEAEKRGKMLLRDLGLENRESHLPSELSGGEQQRVAVARALMNEPDVLLADEPSGNLDSENAALLHDLFFELRDKLGITIIIVTHNEELAARADRTLRMADGNIIAD
ncbi:MAG TPA: ABC transporter ATP-binding protein [Flavobacteriales bacterium]|nr:ABC transporter ATP-binding protein [Flavobacteriales bacterium]HIB76762.1 ABC transporter ATP-binding protein [Flavobacteriales bacterium]HIN41410.1 ABC transporter ATP-binding protein [Flavobacteriales bacterium]HIO15665.1 ABC transporter ATP-binding protein [Flavobacteriales bacterium]